MKKIILAAFALVMAGSAAAQNYPVERNIDVTTTAKTMVTPNKYYVRIVVSDNIGKGRKGIEETEKNVLIPTLRNQGVDIAKQLTFSNIESNFVKQKLVLSKSYQLITTDAEQLNNVIVALQKAGIAEVGVQRAVFADSDATIDELKAEAMRRAKASAEIFAKEAGERVGEVLYVRYYEMNYNTESRPMLKSAMMADAAVAENDYEPLSFRDIELSVNLQVIFKLVK